ncbi:MAG: hypothetical protein WCT01_04175 [Candidatus Shapirobacteria bacterium]|jgi:hypothetical protein
MSRRINTLLGSAATAAATLAILSSPDAAAQTLPPVCHLTQNRNVCTLPQETSSKLNQFLVDQQPSSKENTYPDSLALSIFENDFTAPPNSTVVITSNGTTYRLFVNEYEGISEVWATVQMPGISQESLPIPVSRTDKDNEIGPVLAQVVSIQTTEGPRELILATSLAKRPEDGSQYIRIFGAIDPDDFDINKVNFSSYGLEDFYNVYELISFEPGIDGLDPTKTHQVINLVYSAPVRYADGHSETHTITKGYDPETQKWGLSYYIQENRRVYLPFIDSSRTAGETHITNSPPITRKHNLKPHTSPNLNQFQRSP